MTTSDKAYKLATDPTPVDLDKRRTLLCMTAVAAGGILASTPLMSRAASSFSESVSKDSAQRLTPPAELDVYLISMPGFKRETLRLINRTDHAIAIHNFRASKLVFDGEIVDCNDACIKSAIELPAGTDRLVQFQHTDNDILMSVSGEYMDVDQQIERLSAGTRVIYLQAFMDGNAAVLTLPTAALAA